MIHRLPVVRQNCLTCSRPDMHISLPLDVKQHRGVHYLIPLFFRILSKNTNLTELKKTQKMQEK